MENLHPVAMLLITTAAIFVGGMLCYVVLLHQTDKASISYPVWQELNRTIHQSIMFMLLLSILASGLVLYSILLHPFYNLPNSGVVPVPSVPMPEQSQRKLGPVYVSASLTTNTTAG